MNGDQPIEWEERQRMDKIYVNRQKDKSTWLEKRYNRLDKVKKKKNNNEQKNRELSEERVYQIIVSIVVWIESIKNITH